MVFQRAIKNLLRIKLASVVKLIQVLITSATILLIFQRLGDDERSIQNRNGVLFFIVLNTVFNGFQSVLLLFPDERSVFLREKSSGMYSLPAYFLGRVCSEVPNMIWIPSLLICVTYFVLGLSTNPITVFFTSCK